MRTCSVDGCHAPILRRGLCNKHYLRLMRHGTTDDPRPTFKERFWSKVDKNGPNGCWIFRSSDKARYGQFRMAGKGSEYRGAHRVAYELCVGTIPEGMTVDHLCRNTKCVNPAHLEAVTSRENNLRSRSPSAHNAAKTRCIRGHEFTAENTYTSPDGRHRQCRICMALRSRKAVSR